MNYKEQTQQNQELARLESLRDCSPFIVVSDTGDKIICKEGGVETVIFKDAIMNFKNSFLGGI